jgi:hypothetical protein
VHPLHVHVQLVVRLVVEVAVWALGKLDGGAANAKALAAVVGGVSERGEKNGA